MPTDKPTKPNYTEAKIAAARAMIRAFKSDDAEALSNALEEHYSYCPMMGESEKEGDEEASSKGAPSIAMILAKTKKAG